MAELDAFLMHHYARLPAVEIDLETVPDVSFRRTAAWITASTGYRLRAFDLSVDHAVPCACVVAQAPGGGRGRPALLCSAAAHPDPVAALNSATREAGPLLDHLCGVHARHPGRAAEPAADPEQVRQMPDHALRYAHTDAFDRLAHLVDNGSAPVDLASAFGGRRRPAGETLDVHVRDLAGRFASCGMDVLVADQTTAEHAAAGLRCVRVLAPGAVPMTFRPRVPARPRPAEAADGAECPEG
ncbi:ribosomal protein S12 methylthiotransferase accessory factor [Streptomyces pini]|uniref:Ribosomal protein S12 methylthiotransferase accessory factor n=1 Tax=Streptomyces pini TaxID=1520580 RepID=A0A1I4GST3_9ACTN|nr:YcaO-like family protein [Streptomyces pini]SFL33074.1 ribosomal protein S12 methylthiotransferase accessory factor [Streptomyces pini]